MDNLIFIPPITFIIVLILVLIQYFFMGKLSAVGKDSPGKLKAYACGEDVENHRFSPDYSQFFSFAFFFTIMHVVALVVATMPKSDYKALALAIVYVVISAVSLFILLRRS